jgi:hypothetical protein
MADKQQIQNIKTKIERTIQGLRTKLQEFSYEQTGGFVKPNTLYSVYYTLDKDEVYLTGITQSTDSKRIYRILNKTMFSKYTEIKSALRSVYPDKYVAKPSESDYEIGTINRFFAKKGNDKNDTGFEISSEDYNQPTSLYEKEVITWTISGKKIEVLGKNIQALRILEQTIPNASKTFPPLQFWKPVKGTIDDVQNKLSLT